MSHLQENEMLETVTVAVIGASRPMTPLLSRMLEYDYVDVRLIVDSCLTAPGMLIAQSLGVPTSANVEDVFAVLPELDFLFCIKDDELRGRIVAELQRTGNRRTVLMNQLATRFIMSLSKDARELMRLSPPPASA